MNWETVTTGLGLKVYTLWNNGRKLLTLAFKSGSNFAKIEVGDEKRAFTLRYEGLFRNKMVMRNEYGVRLGQVSTENNEHFINLYDEKLYYTITDDKDPKLIIYKDAETDPIAECSLKLGNEKGLMKSVKTSATTYSLLLTMCWYLFSHVGQEASPKFA